MALKLEAPEAKEKLNEYILEIEKLLNKPQNKEKKNELDTRIKNFVWAFFEDPEKKLRPYRKDKLFISYVKELETIKNHLKAWKEEVKLEKSLEGDKPKSRNFIGATSILLTLLFAIPKVLPEKYEGLRFILPEIVVYFLGFSWGSITLIRIAVPGKHKVCKKLFKWVSYLALFLTVTIISAYLTYLTPLSKYL